MDINTILTEKGVGVRGIGVKEAARQIGISRQSLWFARTGRPIGPRVKSKIAAWAGRNNADAEDLKVDASD